MIDAYLLTNISAFESERRNKKTIQYTGDMVDPSSQTNGLTNGSERKKNKSIQYKDTPADSGLAKSGGSIERKKKKSVQYKGVLDKRDLAEAYACDTEKKKKKAKGGGGGEGGATTPTDPVKAVEYEEYSLEDFLSKGSVPRSKSNHKIYETVRRLSEVSMVPNKTLPSNNNTLSQKDLVSFGLEAGTTPYGYEPEHSLRRVSTSTQSATLPASSRRRSALDRPFSVSSASQPSYEAENSLQRPGSRGPSATSPPASVKADEVDAAQHSPKSEAPTRKSPSDSSTKGRMRERRNGMVLQNPIEILKSQSQQTASSNPKVQFALYDPPSTSPEETSRSPIPGFLRRGKPSLLRELSIPENQAVLKIERSPVSSPKPRRKFSKSKSPISPNFSFSLSSGSQQTYLTRTASETQLSTDSGSPTGSLRSVKSSMMSPTPSDLPASSIKAKPETWGATHNNAARYWEWYLLNASYSWKNFNSDRRYCY